MEDQYVLAAGRGMHRTMGSGVIAAYLTPSPPSYTLPDLMGATQTRDLGKPAPPFLSAPSIASSNSAIVAERGMMTSSACSEPPGEASELGE